MILSPYGFFFIWVKLENNSKFFDLPHISNVGNVGQGHLIMMFQPVLHKVGVIDRDRPGQKFLIDREGPGQSK